MMRVVTRQSGGVAAAARRLWCGGGGGGVACAGWQGAAPSWRQRPCVSARGCATRPAEAGKVVDEDAADGVERLGRAPHNDAVAKWLYVCAAVVGGVVCFGGITRLTESGLSIVQWKPITGVRPPLTREEWEREFDTYKQFPEFKQKPTMTLHEFKYIFFWEWAHRVLARGVGVVFGVPLAYYAARGYFAHNRAFAYKLLGVLALGGAQGFMGWYMVRSGLDERLLIERKKATVSAYRLTSHLFLAFSIYVCMLRLAYSLRLPRCLPGRFAQQPWARRVARVSCATMFVTAMSGAFVAGLDAGLLYGTGFPFMAGGIVPPRDHLFALHPLWRNVFENGAMVQTLHRLLAGATFVAITVLNSACSRRRGAVPACVRRNLMYINAALVTQFTLGAWALLSEVDVAVATGHQVCALVLLASLLRMCVLLSPQRVLLA